jgi:ribonuclease J
MSLPKNHLIFLPLGGCGEIGMNVNLYHYQGKWICLDFGAGFADDYLPGVDMLAPDISYIKKLGSDFLGVVLTHAHEDHLGALPYIWGQIQCPVWATPFTASIALAKMRETEYSKEFQKKLTVVKTGSRFKIGEFDLEMAQITHSIPEMNGVCIRTAVGNVFHTGDWKLDPAPVIPPVSDESKLTKFGDEGILAMVCDSTNVFKDGHSGSEAELKDNISRIIAGSKNLVAVTTFASNVARVETIARAALENNRKVILTGRSLWTVTQAARENGYLQDIPAFLTDQEFKRYPRKDILVICTGCQGEPMAAMSKLMHESHPTIRLVPGDTVVFSSKVIPGNEKKIFSMFNRLVKIGVEVFEEKDHFVHVSGHPNREELKRMYEMVRPKISVPVHGEAVHLHEHVKFAKAMGIPKQIEMENGLMVKLAPGEPEKIGHVEAGFFGVFGRMLLPPKGPVLKTRRRLRDEGLVIVSITLSKRGGLAAVPQITAPGLLDVGESGLFLKDIAEELADIIDSQRNPSNDNIIKVARAAMRRIFSEEFGRRPTVVEVLLTRV